MTSDAATQADGIALRPATPQDLDAIAAIERESFSLPWSRRSFGNLVQAPEAVFLVATNTDGTVVGYAVLLVAGDESELANLAVSERMRGHGIGRRLLAESTERARSRNVKRMYLEVRESNVAAQTLYVSAGFHPVAKRRRYYEQPVEDAIVLLRHLIPVEEITGTSRT